MWRAFYASKKYSRVPLGAVLELMAPCSGQLSALAASDYRKVACHEQTKKPAFFKAGFFARRVVELNGIEPSTS